MKRVVVQLELVLNGYHDEDVCTVSKDTLGDIVFQSDAVLQDCLIQSWRIEEQ